VLELVQGLVREMVKVLVREREPALVQVQELVREPVQGLVPGRHKQPPTRPRVLPSSPKLVSVFYSFYLRLKYLELSRIRILSVESYHLLHRIL